MQWYYVFVLGAITGTLTLLFVSGGRGAAAVSLPELYWTLDLTKYLFSLFIATILMMMFMMWYFA
jgi:hypothetical protein